MFAREQAAGHPCTCTVVPPAPAVTVTEGDAWLGVDVAKQKPPFTGQQARMAWPKRKWRLVKSYLELELNET